MSRILDTARFRSTSSDAPIAFEHSTGAAGMHTRHLTLDGKAAYELTFTCGTCYFLFERLDGAIREVRVKELIDSFHQGVVSVDDKLLGLISPVIPAGPYVVSLIEIAADPVSPLSDEDYFSHEQVELWGIDPFWGLPHHPKTMYYRSPVREMGDNRALFEFVVPMYPQHWLDENTYLAYAERIKGGARPTALAISVLDVVQPADWEGDPAINEHWCLAHFLLDGHHKTYAASRVGEPFTLLSFLALEESIARDHHVETIVQLLSS